MKACCDCAVWAIGFNEQIFGVNEQILGTGSARGARAQQPGRVRMAESDARVQTRIQGESFIRWAGQVMTPA
jgi:hypothetical protein